MEAAQEVAAGPVNRQSRRGGHWMLPPNLERAKVAREPRPVFLIEQTPQPDEIAPVVAVFTEATVTCYVELVDSIRDKLAVLKIKYEDFDDLAGFAKGMTGKALGPAKVKRLGPEKLFDALRTAGLRLRVENDPLQHEAMSKRIAERFNPRRENQARPRNGNHARPSDTLIDRVLGHLSRNNRGGLARLNEAAKQARSNWAQHAAKVRKEKRQAQPVKAKPPPGENLVGSDAVTSTTRSSEASSTAAAWTPNSYWACPSSYR